MIDEILTMDLPAHNISVRPADTSRHDEVCKKLWQDHGIVAVHFQDRRVSEKVRAVLVYLGNTKWGRRAT